MTVIEAVDLLRLLLAVSFLILAALAAVQWRARPGPAPAWLSATFAVLGIVAAIDWLIVRLPENLATQVIQRSYVAILGFYPYFLYRFTATFKPSRRWVTRVAEFLTGLVVFAAIMLPPPPAGGQRSLVWQSYLIVFGLQWIFISSVVAGKLWSAGKGQPTVARRRMRTMGLGSATLTITLVLAGIPQDENSVLGVVFRIIALASGPLFLLGFSPPRWVLAVWRRKDEVALREAEIQLMKALLPHEVAESLLPHLSRLVGARGAAMTQFHSGIIGSHGLSTAELNSLEHEAKGKGPGTDPVESNGKLWIPLQSGWLVVLISPFSPYFGREEAQTLQALAVLADMALARAMLFEREKQNSETMRDFVAIASHELRTPITVLQGFAGMLKQRDAQLVGEKRQNILDAIERQSRHLGRLVEDLLTVSKLEAQTMEPTPVNIDLYFAAEIVADEALLDEVEIDLRIPPNTEVWVDPDHLHRMLTNYIRNAATYGKPPIVMDSRINGEFVEVRVSDHGPGVSKAFEPKLFTKFARADKKVTNAIQGTGLGLSIVRGLAMAAGGEAWYEPNHPNGAIFALRIPRSRKRSYVRKERKEKSLGSSGG